MDIIYTQPYMKIERKIEACQQYQVERIEYIHIYAHKITTPSHSFKMSDVYDVSYKSFSSENGLLYLHTNQGVFPYFINVTSQTFIDFYHSLK